MSKKVRLGIIGIGNMGSSHLKMYTDGKIKEMELVAVCDVKQDRLDSVMRRQLEISAEKKINGMLRSRCLEMQYRCE